MNVVRAISGRLGFGTADYRIFRAGMLLASFGGVAKLFGIARDMVVASKFGVGDQLDAYVVAFTIPSLIISIFVASFGTTMIPTYVMLRKDNARAASALIANLLVLVCVVSAIAVIAVGLGARPFVGAIASRFSPEKTALTLNLLHIFLPMIFIQGVSSFWGSVLNAEGRFAVAASTPIITSTLSTFAVWRFGAHYGIGVLAAATLGGVTLEAAVVLWAATKNSIPWMPRWHGYGHDTRAVVGQYFPYLVGVFITGGVVFVDQAVASRLAPGSIAALSYGNKLVTVVLTLAAAAMGTAVLPYFSRFVAARDWRGARNCLHRWTAVMFLALLVVTALFLLFSNEIVAVIFQRGAFTPAETKIVADIVRGYSLQLPFYCVAIIYGNMMVALRMNRFFLSLSILKIVLTVSLDILLARFIGVVGIAIACSMVYASSFVYEFMLVRRRFRHEIRMRGSLELLRMTSE